MKKILFSIFLILITPALLCGQEIDKSILGSYDTALVIYNRSTAEEININATLSASRVSPCSTFKIYNTLIGLDLGLIEGADAPWYKWDEIHRSIDACNITGGEKPYGLVARDIVKDVFKSQGLL